MAIAADYILEHAVFCDPMASDFRVRMWFKHISNVAAKGIIVEILHDELARFYGRNPVERSDAILSDPGLINYALMMALRKQAA